MAPAAIDPDAFDAFEAAGWERQAAGYEGFLGDITATVAEPLLDAVAVGPGIRLLDLATGPGHVAALAAARGASAVGVDVAAAMVAVAGRLHPEVEFRRADVHELPFEDASFDAVVGNFMILHLGRPERAMTEFARVLSAGGAVALTTWSPPDRGRLLGLFLDAVENAGAQPPRDLPAGPDLFRFSNDAEFDRLLRGAGFGERAIETIDFVHRVATADDLWNGFLAGSVRTAALVSGQPDAMRARIRLCFDELVAEYRRQGSLEIPVSVKLASGRLPA